MRTLEVPGISGADIKDFLGIRSSLEGETLARGGQDILDRLAGLRVPVVAAIHGACLGGGLETALACRYRIASDDPKTSLGLPDPDRSLVVTGVDPLLVHPADEEDLVVHRDAEEEGE